MAKHRNDKCRFRHEVCGYCGEKLFHYNMQVSMINYTTLLLLLSVVVVSHHPITFSCVSL